MPYRIMPLNPTVDVVKRGGKLGSLSATKVKTLKEAGRYGDGDGLYLVVSPNGSRSWVQRIVADGSRRDVGLGGYPTVGLAVARQLAADNRQRVQAGRLPLSALGRRKAATSARAPKASKPTFEAEARAFHAENTGARWTNPKNVRAWLQRAEKYLFPSFGAKAIDAVTGADVLDVLAPLQTTKPETAMRLRVITRQVFARAQARGLVNVNPAGEGINGGLPPRPAASHMVALHYSQVADALRAVESSDAYLGTRLAFKFMVLTATRGAEARGALWSEVDFEAAVWTMPAERMKQSRAHVVPLSAQALAVLEQTKGLAGDSPYVFPGTHMGKHISDNTFGKLARQLALGCNPHGFRSSFRDWAAECSSASWAAVELSLAHSVGSNVERAYFRSDLLGQRRDLMQAWADYLGQRSITHH